MRHDGVNKTTLILAALLVLVASLFAWLRSREPAPADSGSTPPGEAGPAPGEAASTPAETPGPDGRAVYVAECAFCHGDRAEARSSLGGRVAEIARADGGEDYLVDLLLYGLDGRTEGEPAHPPFDHLEDAEIAAVIGVLRGVAGPPGREAAGPAVSAAAVEERRALGLDPARVSEARRAVLDALGRGRR